MIDFTHLEFSTKMAWRLLETGVLKCFGKLVGTIGSELASFVALTCDSSVTRANSKLFSLIR